MSLCAAVQFGESRFAAPSSAWCENGSVWRWGGPVAVRKPAPDLTDRTVSAPRAWLGRSMNQVSGAGKTIDWVFALLCSAAKPVVRAISSLVSTCCSLCSLASSHCAVCDRGPGGGNRVSGVDGIRCFFSVRNAPDGARPQHRGCGLLDLGLQSQESRRLEEAAATSVFVAANGTRRRIHRARRARLQDYDGSLLLLAGATMPFQRELVADEDRGTPIWGALSVGAFVRLVSGLTGVGGGAFLAPALIAMHWASPKQTAALSAPFILANSAVGLVGVLLAGQSPSPHFGLYAPAALGGAIVGTAIGLRWLGQAATRFVLASILITAGIQLVFF
jgi:Sulfite exporter TauE/SafE